MIWRFLIRLKSSVPFTVLTLYWYEMVWCELIILDVFIINLSIFYIVNSKTWNEELLIPIFVQICAKKLTAYTCQLTMIICFILNRNICCLPFTVVHYEMRIVVIWDDSGNTLCRTFVVWVSDPNRMWEDDVFLSLKKFLFWRLLEVWNLSCSFLQFSGFNIVKLMVSAILFGH